MTVLNSTAAAPPPRIGDRLQVHIDKLAIGGAGLARADGFVLFVDQAAPGDHLEVEVTQVKNRHGEARIHKIISAGPSRRNPPCSFALQCGGCNWQHLEEAEQVRQKDLLLRETLAKFLPGRDIPFESFRKSPRSFHYRNRVQPRLDAGRLGYFRRNSHEFLPVNDCLLVEDPLRDFFKNPHRLGSSHETSQKVELRINQNDQAQFSLGNDEGPEGFSFSQVNRFQNEELIQAVINHCPDSPPSEIWDLYCGGGNFTFPLALRYPKSKITGIELHHGLVRHAREKSAQNKNMTFFCSDVTAWMRRHQPAKNSLILIDPPRAGAGAAVMKALAHSSAKNLIYIACHPVSLARDLATFLEAAPPQWRLAKVQGFEMFPQTDHMETIAHLKVDSP